VDKLQSYVAMCYRRLPTAAINRNKAVRSPAACFLSYQNPRHPPHLAARPRRAWRLNSAALEAPDVFFVLFKGCLFKEKLFRRCQNEEIHDSTFFFPRPRVLWAAREKLQHIVLCRQSWPVVSPLRLFWAWRLCASDFMPPTNYCTPSLVRVSSDSFDCLHMR